MHSPQSVFSISDICEIK